MLGGEDYICVVLAFNFDSRISDFCWFIYIIIFIDLLLENVKFNELKFVCVLMKLFADVWRSCNEG